MSKLFGESQRQLQRRFDTERLADRIEERLFREKITAEDRAFIERMDMFFLATADAAGRPNCSYKGGDPGFVRVLDESTIVFPNYDGNGMYMSMGNVTENANVGLIGQAMCCPPAIPR
jgi:predicted pyridoxine 5'-phosphate oxidase superfamily flavin-nucleotide-binding protein